MAGEKRYYRTFWGGKGSMTPDGREGAISNISYGHVYNGKGGIRYHCQERKAGGREGRNGCNRGHSKKPGPRTFHRVQGVTGSSERRRSRPRERSSACLPGPWSWPAACGLVFIVLGLLVAGAEALALALAWTAREGSAGVGGRTPKGGTKKRGYPFLFPWGYRAVTGASAPRGSSSPYVHQHPPPGHKGLARWRGQVFAFRGFIAAVSPHRLWHR